MSRFDVFEYNNKAVPLVLDVQANLLEDLNTSVVVPLVPEEIAQQESLPKLKPVIKVNGENYILITTDIGAVTKNSLGELVSNIEDTHRQDVIEALDFLFQGF